MNLPILGQWGVLAEGWGRLIGVIVVVGFYLFSAIVKSIGDRGQSDEDKEKARQIAQRLREQIAQGNSAAQIEEANQKRIARKLPYAKSVQDRENKSDWDRRQELKRRQLAQARQEPTQRKPQPPRQESPRMRIEPPPVPDIPVAQAISDDNAEELKRQQYYAKAQAHEARRRSQRQAQRAEVAKIAKTAASHGETRSQQQPKPKQASGKIHDLLNRPNQLRTAILLKEILDKPIAMRDIY